MAKLPEGAYISEARRVVVSQRLRTLADDNFNDARRQCVTKMYSVGVTSFSFVVEDVRFAASIERQPQKHCDIKRLYQLAQNGDIRTDDFLDCLSADLDKVLDFFGESIAKEVTVTSLGPTDLVIREVSNG